MSEIKHTKGNWDFDIATGLVFRDDNEGGKCIAMVHPFSKSEPVWVQSESEIKANAKLISAAPDLLDVCQSFVGFNVFDSNKMADWIMKLDAAIKKAT